MTSETDRGTVFNLRNVLLLIGVIVASIGTIYFATEISDRVSDWGRVVSLLLLSVVYGSLGHHFEVTGQWGLLVDKKGWRWLRITSVLYLLGILAAATSIFVFLGIDAIDRLVRAAIVIVAGLALILLAASRFQDRDASG